MRAGGPGPAVPAQGAPDGRAAGQRRWDEIKLSADPAEIGRARHLTRERLLCWGLGGLTEVAQLLVTELVTNAVVHAGTPARVRLSYDGTLRLEVSDASPEPPKPREPGPDDIGGRGLVLVSLLAQRWGWRAEPGGKTVWCECAGDHAAPLPRADGARRSSIGRAG
ncbi:MAG: ATP-binding protein [Streptomycetales bacterium]